MTLHQRDNQRMAIGTHCEHSLDAIAMTGACLHNDGEALTVLLGHADNRACVCMPLDTEVLTRDGWKHHDEIAGGDETVSAKPEAGGQRASLCTSEARATRCWHCHTRTPRAGARDGGLPRPAAQLGRRAVLLMVTGVDDQVHAIDEPGGC